MKHEAYSEELKFQVGERVHVELDYVPKEQRDTTTGIITTIATHFPSTPKHRKHFYTVRFDGKGNYIKKEFRLYGGVKFEITCQAHRLQKL